jgi:hypothetical protein
MVKEEIREIDALEICAYAAASSALPISSIGDWRAVLYYKYIYEPVQRAGRPTRQFKLGFL